MEITRKTWLLSGLAIPKGIALARTITKKKLLPRDGLLVVSPESTKGLVPVLRDLSVPYGCRFASFVAKDGADHAVVASTVLERAGTFRPTVTVSTWTPPEQVAELLARSLPNLYWLRVPGGAKTSYCSVEPPNVLPTPLGYAVWAGVVWKFLTTGGHPCR